MIKQLKKYLKEKIFGDCELINKIPEITTAYTSFSQDFKPLTIVYPVYITNKRRIGNIIETLKRYENLPMELKKNYTYYLWMMHQLSILICQSLI